MTVLGRFQRSSKAEKANRIIRMQVNGTIEALRSYVNGHEDDLYRLDITYHNKRSLPQNARFHAMAMEYGKEAGYTLDEAKSVLKHQFGVVVPFGEGFVPPDREGRFVQLYGEIEFQVSTAEYSTAEMSKLMDGAEMALAGAV